MSNTTSRRSMGRNGWLTYLAMGFLAEPLVNLSLLAAEQLMDPAEYVETVLGGVS